MRLRCDGTVLPRLPLIGYSLFGGGRATADTAIFHTLDPSTPAYAEQIRYRTAEDTGTLAVDTPRRLGYIPFCRDGREGLAPMLAPELWWTARDGRALVTQTAEYRIDDFEAGRLVRSIRRKVPRVAGTADAVARFFPGGKSIGSRDCVVSPAGTSSESLGAHSRIDAADLIVTGGKVRSGTGWVDALAVRRGVIVAVGDAVTVAKHRGPATRVIDVAGAAVLPSLHDTHVRPLHGGITERRCTILQGLDLAAVQQAVTARVARAAIRRHQRPQRLGQLEGPCRREDHEGDAAAEKAIADRNFYARPNLAADCVKKFLDGVPTDGHTAAMLQPYADAVPMAFLSIETDGVTKDGE